MQLMLVIAGIVVVAPIIRFVLKMMGMPILSAASRLVAGPKQGPAWGTPEEES